MGGAKPKPVVSVDMQAELKKLGLAEHFPIEVRPPTDAVTQLAVWIKASKKHKGEKAYVFVDLKRFLPAKCPAHLTSDAAEEDVGDNANASSALAEHFESAAKKARAQTHFVANMRKRTSKDCDLGVSVGDGTSRTAYRGVNPLC